MAHPYKRALLIVVAVMAMLAVAVGVMYGMREVRHGTPELTQAKQAQLKQLARLPEELAPPGENKYNPLERDTGPRDSGRRGVGLFIRHTVFRIVGGIGFDTDTLSALLVPTDPPRPVTLDDPTSFVFKPLHGSVIMPPSALAALFNQYLTDYPGTQLRNLSVSTRDDGTLVVDGQTQKVPGLWLPFHMTGPVHLVQGHLFIYTPKQIKIAHLEAKGLLKAIRLQLSNLVQIDTQGARIEGDSVVLDLNHSLPPPAQDVHVASLKIDHRGVHLRFTSAFDPKWPQPIVDTDSYILLDGGDVKTFRSLITHVRLQMVAGDGGKLDTSLYAYRQQIVHGHFEATPAGELVAYLAPYRAVSYLPPAKPNGKANDASAQGGDHEDRP
ncbi:hypothetical protein [Salinisphaera hydrothermalis]|uniref:hypothetical protein n=1 Tax=Salinisphaera hydrothermalis TaxID=563188 RepID=UPI00334161F0